MGYLVPRYLEKEAPPFLGPMPPLLEGGSEREGVGLAVGNHTILELWGASAEVLSDEGAVTVALHEAAVAGKLSVLHEVFHSFGEGQGVTGMLLLSSSHLTVHTWPEYGYAAVDIFTCAPENHPSVPDIKPGNSEQQPQEEADPEVVVASLVATFSAGHSRTKSFERGAPMKRIHE